MKILKEIIVRYQTKDGYMVDAIDKEEIIRCKDCKHYIHFCRVVDGVRSTHACAIKLELDDCQYRVTEKDFCSWAERRAE